MSTRDLIGTNTSSNQDELRFCGTIGLSTTLRTPRFPFAKMFSEGINLLGNIVDPARAVCYPPKVEILQQDQRISCAFFVVSGIIKLAYLHSDGREVIVGLRQAGTMVGASALILNESNNLTAATVTSCKLVRLDCKHFMNLLNTDPSFAQYVHQLHASENQRSRQKNRRYGLFTCARPAEEISARSGLRTGRSAHSPHQAVGNCRTAGDYS